MFTVLWGAWHKYCFLGCCQRLEGKTIGPSFIGRGLGVFLITVGQIEGPCLSAHGPGRGWLQSGGLWPDWTLGPGHRAHQLLMSQEEMTTWAATGGRVGGGCTGHPKPCFSVPWTLRIWSVRGYRELAKWMGRQREVELRGLASNLRWDPGPAPFLEGPQFLRCEWSNFSLGIPSHAPSFPFLGLGFLIRQKRVNIRLSCLSHRGVLKCRPERGERSPLQGTVCGL